MEEGFSDPKVAEQFGLPYVVIRKVRPYDTATLNYNWQVWDTQAFSLYTTTTAKIDQRGAGQAILAVMNFLSRQQIIRYSIPDRVEPRILLDTELISVRTARSGIFWALTKAGDQVEVGQPLAEILRPL